jgi:hypothetical protein
MIGRFARRAMMGINSKARSASLAKRGGFACGFLREKCEEIAKIAGMVENLCG